MRDYNSGDSALHNVGNHHWPSSSGKSAAAMSSEYSRPRHSRNESSDKHFRPQEADSAGLPGRKSHPSLADQTASALPSQRLSTPLDAAASRSQKSLAPPRAPWLQRGSSSNADSSQSQLSLTHPLDSVASASAPPSPAGEEVTICSPISSRAKVGPWQQDAPPSAAKAAAPTTKPSKDSNWRRFRTTSISLLKRQDKPTQSHAPTTYALEEPTRPTPTFANGFVPSPVDSGSLDLPHLAAHAHPQNVSLSSPESPQSSSLHSDAEASPRQDQNPPYPHWKPVEYLPSSKSFPFLPPMAFEGLGRLSYFSSASELDGLSLSPGEIVDQSGKIIPVRMVADYIHCTNLMIVEWQTDEQF